MKERIVWIQQKNIECDSLPFTIQFPSKLYVEWNIKQKNKKMNKMGDALFQKTDLYLQRFVKKNVK